MTFRERNNAAPFNGTTPVTIVPAPSTALNARHVVRKITGYNADSVQHTMTVRLASSSTSGPFPFPRAVLESGESAEWDVGICDSTSKSIQGVLGSTHATNAPTFSADYAYIDDLTTTST